MVKSNELKQLPFTNLDRVYVIFYFAVIIIINIIIIIIIITILIIIIIIIIIELTHSKIKQENIAEIEPQPVALDFKSLSQYSSPSK